MAKQLGIFKVEGTIGDVTFYKSKDGFRIRSKGGVNRDKILNGPSYQRTRENLAEFGRAGKAGKTLRMAFLSLLQQVSDGRMVSRLTREMYRVIQSDADSNRGQRNVLDGETEMLQGFEFNEAGKLSTTIMAPYTVGIDRATGKASLSVPAYTPTSAISAPPGTTHYRLMFGAAEINFEAEVHIAKHGYSGMLPWNSATTAVFNLEHVLTPNSSHPLFAAFGVQFFQEMNGNYYPLNDSSHNALAVVKVDGAA